MKFLFGYEQVRRPLETLSGGEWTRLQLLLLMLRVRTAFCSTSRRTTSTSNRSRCSSRALESFEGTAIFVSHDRYFLDRIADRILEVSDGNVRSFEGGWSTWRERQALPV